MKTHLISKEFNPFFVSIIKKRSFLVESKLSLKNEYKMRNIISKLMPYIGMKFSDKGISKFIIKNYSNIRAIIPSKDIKTIKSLDDFYVKASVYLKNMNQCIINF